LDQLSDLKAKVLQIRFWLGLRPRPRWGELTRWEIEDWGRIEGERRKGRGWMEGKGKGKEGEEKETLPDFYLD